ncbi:Gldg family protein [Chitinophaga sp.]|uniref:Gldg family protein n=1 Tax=Chitinophaga sp. TaxID=1869181 RepID=UPI002F91FCF2
MRQIIKIAKNELLNLFYSPVAWFLTITFFVMCALLYTGTLYPIARGAEMDYKTRPELEFVVNNSITAFIFPGFFLSIVQYVYLFVPLLTMNIISRELNNGTIKLLYSSPVKLRQIVLGKFLALSVYNLVFTLIMSVFVINAFADLRAPDYGPSLSAMFGVYLLLSALTAIGFFMSSLTTYPVVSAIASFTLLAALMSVGRLWQQYDFVRDLTYFLSLKSRTEWMINGLIRSKDVIYYLVIIYMFVGFTLLKLKGGRENRPWYVKAVRYILVTVSGLLVGYVGSRPLWNSYLDTTDRYLNTIRPETQKIVKELGDSVLEVTLYTNLLDNPQNVAMGLPGNRNNYLSLWEQYIRFKPDIKFSYEYYYAVLPGDSILYKKFPGKTLQQIAGLMAKGYQVDSAMFKSPEEIRQLADLEPEGYVLIAQMKYQGRKVFLRILPTLPSEIEVVSTEPYLNAAFKRLLGTQMPKLTFVSGNLERSIYKRGEREYSRLRNLVNLGFDLDTVNLATKDIDTATTVLILADPKMDLNPVVLGKLRHYLNNGGDMLIMGEPRKQYVVNPLLRQLGVQLMEGQLVQPSRNETPDQVGTYQTTAYFNLNNQPDLRYVKHLWAHNIYYEDLAKIITWGIVPIDQVADSGFIVKPLLLTKPLIGQAPEKVWQKMGKLVADSVAPVFNASEGDISQDSFNVAIQLTRSIKGKEQRIIVCGDADLMSNLNTAQPGEPFYSWLSYNRFPVYGTIPLPGDNKILLGGGRAAVMRVIYVWIMPGIMLLLGTVLLLRRTRK